MHKFLKKTLVLLTIFVFAICILTACNKTIKFKLNFIVDGAIYFTIDTEGNNTIEFPTNPTKDSHTFDGWYWDENTWQQPFTANSLLDVPLSSDINVYAKFNHIHSDNDWLTISSSPATEDSEGYINYTCRVCGENKTETINKLDHIHNYSYEWQANSAQHWHECPKDGDKVDLADHIYDLSEIVLQPTEDTTGTIKYTCSTCNYSKTETLEKLPHTHKYSTDWQTNSTQHWHECPKDGDKSNIANHDYDNGFITKDPTEFDYGEIVYTCLVCEYKKSEQLPKLIIDRSGAELLSAEGFTFVDNNGKISLSNATETYSFINKIQVSDYATWTISTDIYGINTISTKTIPLAIGDNVVYLLITSGDGKSMSFYTMTVRRRPVYTVSFNTGIETSVPNQYIEETYCASEPDAIQRDGYTYTWDHSFENPIMQETTIDAIWTPNIDTKYKVEYYHQNLENDNFSLIASDTFTGTTDTIINANVKEYEHFTFNESISTLSENLNGDESTILKVYYDRNSYKVTIASTANVTINNPIDGYYKYGHTIPSTTATFNNYLGYEYLGWYKNGTCVAEHTIPSFSVSDNIEYVAKDKARNDISLFTFTSTTKECIITGLLDKTLTSVTLPNYTTQINNSVFKNCTNLTSIVIPSSITHIGTDAFYNCNSLTSVDYTGTIDQWVQIKFGNYYSNPIYYAENLYINNELVTEANITTATSINAYAFYSCDSLTSVTIGNSVTSIGDDAFCGCDSLMSVTIGNSVTSIGSYAFYNCSSLTSIVIPDSVTRLGAHALGGCNSLVSITVPFVSSSIGYLFSTFQSAGSIAIKYYYNEVNTSYYNTYYIPSGLKSVTVTGGNIPYKSFYDCDNITSITIGDSVTSIEERAFYDCNGLTSVTIGNSVTSIGSSAFYGCARLIEVYNLSSLSITAGSTSNGYVGCYAKDIYTSFDTSSKLSTDSNGYIIYTNGKEKILVGYSGNETELTLPNDITEIYRYAFYNYASLTRITIGNTTTSIGDWAFYNCPIEYASMPTTAISAIPKGKLKEVVITSGNGIGSSAFHSCNALTSVTIGNSVTSIGSQAFSYCFSLTNVTIGNSVTSIGENAFYNCSSLSSVNINSIESWCGITFETDYSNPLYCAKKLYLNGEIVTNLVIPNTVTKIKDYAFYDYDDLTSIIIPNSVNSIERYAFRYCSNLTICCKAESKPSGWDSSWNYSNRPVVWGISEGILVVINDTKYYLEDTNAIVTGCKGTLTELIIPSTITYNNSNYSVTSICDKAFLDCNGLTSVTIPDSVTSIGSSAFYDCDGLTSIIIPTSVTNIEDHAFSYCSNLTICCKAESKPSGWGFYWNYSYRPAVWGINEGIVVVINDTKYYLEDANAIVTGCQGTLTELIIPSTITYNNSNYSVTSICDNAFYDCNVLTSVTIGNFVTSIGKNAFESCDRLISITIGNSVTSIGDFAFYDCDGLTSVTIPDSVTSIESYAFYDCDGLLRVAIGNSITSIGDFAFSSCPIEYANIPTKFISSIPQSKLKELVITSGDVIENNAFYKCTSLISVTIPNSITNIGDSAFFGCTSLTSINLPYSVISIADYVFSSCSSLTRVIIPNSVMSMGEFAFESCSRLTIYCEAESKPSGWSSSWNNSNRPVEWGFRDIIIINGFTYSVNSSNAILVTNDGTQTDLVIPSTIEHVGTTLSVIGIESEAFYGHTNLTSVTIPNSITSIGDSAFFGCSSLTSVVIPDSVTSIGEYAFEGCSSLTSVNYLGTIEQWCGIKFAWGMTSPLGAKLYLNGELIEDLVIPNTVTEIKDYAFNGCTSIKSVTIPDSVTSIGDSAFSGCTSLTSINIGNSVTSIGICAFNYCTSLSSLSIPNSVISIGDYAFEDCTSLNSVELGSSVKSIGTGAFLYCSSLTSIIIPASVIYIGDEAFKDCTSLIDVNIVGNAFMQWGGYKTFYNCDSLTNLIIGDDITIIDSSLFESCDNLKNVVLGISVTKISLGAFYDCPNISNVFYKGTQTISIEGANESIIEATKYYYSETEPIEEGNYWHYVDGVVTIW